MTGPQTHDLAVGSVLIETDVCLPHAVRIECHAFSIAWETIAWPDRRTFERELEAAGWSLFHLAGKITATALGSDKEKTSRRAVGRVLTQVGAQGFNCVEITEIATRSFCRVPYVSVSAHARHVQQGIFLSTRKRSAKGQGLPVLVPAAAEG